MNLNMCDSNIDFNHGIGLYPISIFVKLSASNEDAFPIDEAYRKITEYGCNDIIFYGDIGGAYESGSLNWVTSYMVSNGYHVSVVSNQSIPIITSRVINIVSDPKFLKVIIEKKYITAISPRDILILVPQEMRSLMLMRRVLLNHSDRVKSKVMVCNDGFEVEDFMKNKIFDMEPYNGERFWE